MKMAEDMRPVGVASARLSEAPLRALTKVLVETANSIGKTRQASCPHFVGYLKTRSKDSPVPDECLTCAALMKCM